MKWNLILILLIAVAIENKEIEKDEKINYTPIEKFEPLWKDVEDQVDQEMKEYLDGVHEMENGGEGDWYE
jgi:hypothetical protein